MLEQGMQYSAVDFIELKAKVKAEMLRRCHTGSLAAYGGGDYDFAKEPKVGEQITAEQANKIIGPINAIADSGISLRTAGSPAIAMNQLYDKIVSYASAPLEGEGHGCNASCSGLCHTECSGVCSGDCSGECGGSCTTSCGSNCTGSCTDVCTGCTGGCYTGCSTTCTAHCAYTCEANCDNTCQGGCSENCASGCSGGCSTTCSGTCLGSNSSGIQE